MRKHERYIKRISELLQIYKNNIDMLETEYTNKNKRITEYADSMKGKWTDDYIKEYIVGNSPDNEIKTKMQITRKGVESAILSNLDNLQNTIEKSFNAPVKPDFANKIMAIKVSGLKLSNLEFEMLKNSVSSYFEGRLLNELAETRTRTESKIELDASGTPRQTEIEVNNRYHIDLPDIDAIYKAFSDYKNSVNSLLYRYSGKNAKMSHLLDEETPNYISVAMDSYFRNHKEDEFMKTMDSASAIFPSNKEPLTENEVKFIDELVDKQYPTLAKERVRTLANCDEYIADLLERDERYACYLDN